MHDAELTNHFMAATLDAGISHFSSSFMMWYTIRKYLNTPPVGEWSVMRHSQDNFYSLSRVIEYF